MASDFNSQHAYRRANCGYKSPVISCMYTGPWYEIALKMFVSFLYISIFSGTLGPTSFVNCRLLATFLNASVIDTWLSIYFKIAFNIFNRKIHFIKKNNNNKKKHFSCFNV